MKTRIIVDSTADLMPGYKEQVRVVPLTVHFGDREYIDGVTIDHKTFYEKLVEEDTLPTTSQATPDAFAKEFEAAKQAGESCVVITLSGKLSGTCQSASIAAADYENVYVVDSGNASVGGGILTELALQLRDEGLSAPEIAARLDAEKRHIVTVALVDTLEYLKRGGRISKSLAFAGTMLQIKPVLAVTDGEIQLLGKARGSKMGNNLLAQEIQKAGGVDFSRPVLLGYTGLSDALLQKYIRIKRIKVNGGRAQRDQRLTEGDVVQLYINDEFFDKPSEENMFLTLFKPQVDIVYEDENLLLVNKRPGLVVHADETEKVNTLINHIQAYLYQKREWNPRWENAFAPALCNRIDRNTGGMVIAAKNAETLRIINEKIRLREIDKRYLCITVGRPKPPEGRIECFLLKNEQKKQVSVYHKPVPGGKTAVTDYRTLETRGELSLVEVGLETGRTHQIRASFADLGCPLLGDGKYGRGDVNRRYGETRQALYAYELTFDLPTDAGLLNYLRGRTFTVENVPFRAKYFG